MGHYLSELEDGKWEGKMTMEVANKKTTTAQYKATTTSLSPLNSSMELRTVDGKPVNVRVNAASGHAAVLEWDDFVTHLDTLGYVLKTKEDVYYNKVYRDAVDLTM